MAGGADSPGALLLAVFREPARFIRLTERERSGVIRLARINLVLGRLAAMLRARGLLADCNQACRGLLEAGAVEAAYQAGQLRWAIDRVLHALRGRDLPVVLLKGGAYLQCGLPIAEGRLVSDLDILVPRSALRTVERSLRSDGWAMMDVDEYDQHYYRTWMHELPPFQHPRWGLILDVHHNILPETSRLRPDPTKLLAAALATPQPGVAVLAPSDMVLHNCVHLFHDGDLANGLRELLDLDGLLRHFSGEPGFWRSLLDRGAEQGLLRPLYYGMTASAALLGTPVPGDVQHAARAAAPPWPLDPAMRGLIAGALRPRLPGRPSSLRRAGDRLLYVRSHWLRMPPALLARHLFTKARKRLGPAAHA
ncbi:MAG: nucleotidyltransferase family protein [Chromatiales bacterium]